MENKKAPLTIKDVYREFERSNFYHVNDQDPYKSLSQEYRNKVLEICNAYDALARECEVEKGLTVLLTKELNLWKAEVEELRAERETYYNNFRADYDVETKDLQSQLSALRLRNEELEIASKRPFETNTGWPHEKKLIEENKQLRAQLDVARELLKSLNVQIIVNGLDNQNKVSNRINECLAKLGGADDK
jgi:hypothetical protein